MMPAQSACYRVYQMLKYPCAVTGLYPCDIEPRLLVCRGRELVWKESMGEDDRHYEW